MRNDSRSQILTKTSRILPGFRSAHTMMLIVLQLFVVGCQRDTPKTFVSPNTSEGNYTSPNSTATLTVSKTNAGTKLFQRGNAGNTASVVIPAERSEWRAEWDAKDRLWVQSDATKLMIVYTDALESGVRPPKEDDSNLPDAFQSLRP